MVLVSLALALALGPSISLALALALALGPSISLALALALGPSIYLVLALELISGFKSQDALRKLRQLHVCVCVYWMFPRTATTQGYTLLYWWLACLQAKPQAEERKVHYLLYWWPACLQAKPQAEERKVHQPVVLVASMSTS